MKKLLSVNFRLARPKVQPGKGDKYLPKILQDLSNLLRKTQKDFHYDTLRLSADKIRDLSQTLVEFAEDVHNEIDIWNSLEQYNLEFFDTKLPLVPGSAEESAGHAPISKRRIQYLLWNQYQLFNPNLILSPSHQDLIRLSGMVSDFLSDRFKNLPLGSGIKTFFDQPHEFDKNHLYYGGLIPWNGEWYWSGEQKRYDNVSDEDLPKLKNTFFSTPQTIVYRYCKDLADKARESVKEHYRIFVDYHGKDMAVYPDGRSMAVDMRNQYCFHNEYKLKAAGKNPTEHHQSEIPDLTKSFPPDLIECNSGVCIYF
jgi:hypothetical protein